jgi:hypothetical protein
MTDKADKTNKPQPKRTEEKFHYNPVNMAGKKAEHDDEDGPELQEREENEAANRTDEQKARDEK